MRNVSKTVNDLLGLLPLIDPGRSKRTAYDEQTLKVFTKAVDDMRPEEQKQHIIDVALLWKDLIRKSKLINETMFPDKPYLFREESGRPTAAPLDLSDASSSQLKQFNEDFATSVKTLNKTMVSMSTSNLRGIVPFEKFSSIQRQMSYTAGAIRGGLSTTKGIKPLESPSLMSAEEKKMVLEPVGLHNG